METDPEVHPEARPKPEALPGWLSKLALPVPIGMAGICLCVLACRLFPDARKFFEISIYLLILALAVSSPRTKSLLSSIRPLHRRLIAVFIAIMLIGQMYDRPGRLYPFVSWTMYSNATAPVHRLHRLKAKLADGRTVDLPLSLFPIYTLNCATALRALSDKAADPSTKKPQAALESLANFEKAIASAYERDNPGTEIITLILDDAPFHAGSFNGKDKLEWKTCYESPPLR